MPLRTRRRNTAYLNRPKFEIRPARPQPRSQGRKPGPDVRLISMARSSGASERMTVVSDLEELPPRLRRFIEGAKTADLLLK
jgi:hypothetical protein